MRKRKRNRKSHKKKYQQTEKVIERNKKIRLWDKIKTPEKRKKIKTIIYQKYVYRGDKKINKMKK